MGFADWFQALLRLFDEPVERMDAAEAAEPRRFRDEIPWRFAITEPLNGSQSGRFALLQAISPRGYPNNEDYILLVRQPGELFRPVFMVFTPWDEEPPRLLDYAALPRVAIVVSPFFLAWTDDGGGRIHRAPEVPDGLRKLYLFSAHRIERVEVSGEHLYVRVAVNPRPRSAAPDTSRELLAAGDRMWRMKLDGSSERAEPVDPPEFATEARGDHEVLARGGERLYLRRSADSEWEELALDALLSQMQGMPIDEFGGSPTRSIEGL